MSSDACSESIGGLSVKMTLVQAGGHRSTDLGSGWTEATSAASQLC